MNAAAPDILGRRGVEWGLVWTVAVSALVHAGAVALLIAAPPVFLPAPQPLQSYTVDLVAPKAVGGTNLVNGGAARVEAPGQPPAAAPAPQPQPAAASAPVDPVTLAKRSTGDQSRKAPAAPAPPAPESVQPAKPKPQPPAEAKNPKPPPAEAKPPPKVEPATKPPAVVLKAKAVEKPPPPKPPAAKPAAPAKAPPPPKGPGARAGQAATESKPAPAPKAAVAPAPTRPAQTADGGAAALDKRIAAAVQERVARVEQGGQLDDRIAAAVQRRVGQLGVGSRSATPGGPVSVGPGSGSGGTPMDLEFILYQGRMEERIKAAWAWAGANRTLQAVIRFDLSLAGEISNVRTVRSSGDAQYDASCERAVRAASPLDPVPEKYRDAFASGVEMTFKPDDVES